MRDRMEHVNTCLRRVHYSYKKERWFLIPNLYIRGAASYSLLCFVSFICYRSRYLGQWSWTGFPKCLHQHMSVRFHCAVSEGIESEIATSHILNAHYTLMWRIQFHFNYKHRIMLRFFSHYQNPYVVKSHFLWDIVLLGTRNCWFTDRPTCREDHGKKDFYLHSEDSRFWSYNFADTRPNQ
jgi:hypothetical protein